MKILLTALCGAICSVATAQESPYAKFGKITPDALQTKVYAIDSSAGAVVLSDIGESSLEGNTKGWFSIYTTRHKVIHILNKSAYDEASVEINLYADGEAEEKLEDIKAVTYNLENGKVVESKLERSNLFSEKADKNHVIKKFTFPNVKEGSIIEYSYKVSSDFLNNVDPWAFQSHLPTLWSEFVFSVPDFFSYSFISQGYIKPLLNDKKVRYATFIVRDDQSAGSSQSYRISSNVTDNRWVFKNVPELKTESYTSTLRNHIAKLEFQLASRNLPLVPKDYRATWPGLSKELIESEYFGKELTDNNGWLADNVKKLTAGAASETEKAKKIYQYVRDNFVCTQLNSLYTNQSLKATFKGGKGTAAEVNLLLTAMLRNAGLWADPVILSTAPHGYTLEMYPLLSRFNYVVTKVQADGKAIYLDAAHNHLGFARLLPECYNGHARVVNEEATPVYLVADSLKDRKITALLFSKGTQSLWQGHMNQTPGYFESYELRDRIKADGQEKFFKNIQKDLGAEVKLANSQVDSLTNYDDPIGIHYDLEFNPEKEDILYVNPMFGEGYKTNPFKSAERLYPVEMPYATDETYIFNMEVPDGYEVDELPKQIKAKFDEEGKTFFEYLIQNAGGIINLRSRIRIDRAYYEPDEYEVLREFFNLIVKKHSEQIVFKKKK